MYWESRLTVLYRCVVLCLVIVFFVKQKTAYEMRISDWSSDVCSSDLLFVLSGLTGQHEQVEPEWRRDEADAERRHHEDAEMDVVHPDQIGRASCRERVCQYV